MRKTKKWYAFNQPLISLVVFVTCCRSGDLASCSSHLDVINGSLVRSDIWAVDCGFHTFIQLLNSSCSPESSQEFSSLRNSNLFFFNVMLSHTTANNIVTTATTLIVATNDLCLGLPDKTKIHVRTCTLWTKPVCFALSQQCFFFCRRCAALGDSLGDSLGDGRFSGPVPVSVPAILQSSRCLVSRAAAMPVSQTNALAVRNARRRLPVKHTRDFQARRLMDHSPFPCAGERPPLLPLFPFIF